MSIEVSSFIKDFTTPLVHENISTDDQIRPYVFWDASSSNDNGQEAINNMLKVALTNVDVWDTQGIIQYWVQDGEKLSIAGQLFGVTFLNPTLSTYRRLCVSNKVFGLDLHNEENIRMTHPGPIPSFLHIIPRMLQHKDENLEVSVMIPVVLPKKELPAGVIEIAAMSDDGLGTFILNVIDNLKNEGFEVPGAQSLIASRLEKNNKQNVEKLEEWMKLVCEEKDLMLGQAWISHELSSTQIVGLKVAGHIKKVSHGSKSFKFYYDLSNFFPKIQGELVTSTLADHKTRFSEDFHSVVKYEVDYGKGNLCFCCSAEEEMFALEFLGVRNVDGIEQIILSLQQRLPNFKILGGEEYIVVTKNEDSTQTVKLFKEKGNNEEDNTELVKPLKGKGRGKMRGQQLLSEEAVRQQFGKPIKVAAINLGVGETTLRDYSRYKMGLEKWPGVRHKNQDDIQESRPEDEGVKEIRVEEVVGHDETEDGGGVKEFRVEGAVAKDEIEDFVTIKAAYGGDRVKFYLKEVGVTVAAISAELESKFEGLKNFKVKYQDPDDEKWYLIVEDQGHVWVSLFFLLMTYGWDKKSKMPLHISQTLWQ